MKEEVQRIIKLVQEGKLSPEDAADLIDAFSRSEPSEAHHAAQEPSPPPNGPASPGDPAPPRRDPFRSVIETIEKIGKDATDSVNWQDVARQVRDSTKKGVEHLKAGLEEVSKGGFPWVGPTDIREVTLPISVPVGKTLRIENACGDVRIAGGFDVGTVTAKAKFRGATADEARSKAEGYTLIIEESEHMVLVRQPDVTGLSVDLEVQLADSTQVEVRCEAGNVSVLDTASGCRINGRSGNIRLKGLNGPIEISSNSGEISVEESTTPLMSIENKAGNISMVGVTGDANTRTASGNISIVRCSARVLAAESVSGNVTVDLREPIIGNVNVRTVNGNAQVAVPDGSDCRVSLSTLRGFTKCGLELEEETKTEQRVSGRIGGGTGTLDVSAINGNVSVLLRDSAAV